MCLVCSRRDSHVVLQCCKGVPTVMKSCRKCCNIVSTVSSLKIRNEISNIYVAFAMHNVIIVLNVLPCASKEYANYLSSVCDVLLAL
jgi:hypothetical protein